MPLKGDQAPSDAAAIHARDTFERINRLKALPKTTETLSCRVPSNEKIRIRLAFERKGLTLAEGVKKAVYAYLEQLEAEK